MVLGPDIDGNAALAGELRGIAHKVEEDLAIPALVEVEPLGEIGIDFAVDLDVAGVQERLKGGDDRAGATATSVGS